MTRTVAITELACGIKMSFLHFVSFSQTVFVRIEVQVRDESGGRREEILSYILVKNSFPSSLGLDP